MNHSVLATTATGALLLAGFGAARWLGCGRDDSGRADVAASGNRSATSIVPLPEGSLLANLPYGDRQFITLSDESRTVPRGLSDRQADVVFGVPWSAMEAQGIQFPAGHPRRNVLYVSHPLTGTLYYPASDFHRAIFEHKVAESLTLHAALGATRIDVRASYGWGRDFAANLNLPFRNLAGTVDGRGSASQRGVGELVFSATGWGKRSRPELPSNLLWLESEPTWKVMAMAEQNRYRKETSLVTWELRYEKSFGVDAELETRFANLSVGLGGRFQQCEKTLWHVTAEFAKRRRWAFCCR